MALIFSLISPEIAAWQSRIRIFSAEQSEKSNNTKVSYDLGGVRVHFQVQYCTDLQGVSQNVRNENIYILH